MKIIKNIAGRLFAIWGIIMFIIFLFIFTIPMWIITTYNEPKRTQAFYPLSKIWTKLLLIMLGCDLRIKGSEYFKKGENYIVLSNHNSMLDITLTTPFLPGPNKTIAKIEISRVPIFGPISKLGSVLVDRKSKQSRADSFNKMKAILKMGIHMVIYPEGTRNKTSEPLKEFHDGAFRLAVESKKPIIPALVFNTKKAMPVDKSFYFWPATLYLHFLPPVYASEKDTISDLKERLFVMMKDYYVNHQP